MHLHLVCRRVCVNGRRLSEGRAVNMQHLNFTHLLKFVVQCFQFYFLRFLLCKSHSISCTIQASCPRFHNRAWTKLLAESPPYVSFNFSIFQNLLCAKHIRTSDAVVLSLLLTDTIPAFSYPLHHTAEVLYTFILHQTTTCDYYLHEKDSYFKSSCKGEQK